MTRTDEFVRCILGRSGKGSTAFVLAIDLTAKLLFEGGIAMQDILVTKDVYPAVAKCLHMKHTSASRQILRVANRCWNKLSEAQKKEYIGKVLPTLEAPSKLLLYFAVYLHSGKAFFAEEQ